MSVGAMISADGMCGVEIESWLGAAVKVVIPYRLVVRRMRL